MNGRDVLKRFLEEVENYGVLDGSSGKKVAELVIDGELKGTTENFICGISFAPNRHQEEQGKMILGAVFDETAAEVRLVIKVVNTFCFPLKYIEGRRCWMLEVPCQFSVSLRNKLDRIVEAGRVMIEVKTKNPGLRLNSAECPTEDKEGG